MKNGFLRRLWFPAFLLIGLACHVHGCRVNHVSSDFQQIGEIRNTFPVNSNLKWVSIENNVGNLRVIAGSSDSIEIVARVEVSEQIVSKVGKADLARDVFAENSAEGFRLGNAHIKDSDANDWHIHWAVKVPPTVQVSVRNGVGDIDLQALRGEQTVKLGVGNVSVDSPSSAGSQSFETGTGSIQFNTGSSEGPVKLKTGVGTIRLGVKSGQATSAELVAGTGSVHCAVPSSFDGSVDFKTGVGGIRLKPKGNLQPGGTSPGAALEGVLGAGSAKLKARTGVGDIYFSRE